VLCMDRIGGAGITQQDLAMAKADHELDHTRQGTRNEYGGRKGAVGNSEPEKGIDEGRGAYIMTVKTILTQQN